MTQIKPIDACRLDLFTAEAELREKYTEAIVVRVLRIREEYNWFIGNPDSRDRQFIESAMSRHGINKTQAYSDLAIIKALLPHLSQASRDFHRYRFNEMILETYQMAKKRKDTKTMDMPSTTVLTWRTNKPFPTISLWCSLSPLPMTRRYSGLNPSRTSMSVSMRS